MNLTFFFQNRTGGNNSVEASVLPNGVIEASRSAQDILHLITNQSNSVELPANANNRSDLFNGTSAAQSLVVPTMLDTVDGRSNCSSANATVHNGTSSTDHLGLNGNVGTAGILRQRFKVRPQLFEAIKSTVTQIDEDSSNKKTDQRLNSPATFGKGTTMNS